MSPVSSHQSPVSDDEPLVRVQGASKKFCLSLKKSLWYGLCDMGREFTGRRHGGDHAVDRPETRDSRLGTTASPSPVSSLQSPVSSLSSSGLRPKEFWAVKDVGFELRRGESLGLIGHNGAGKTTLLKMLNGLIKPDAGRIEMRGRVGALISLGAGFNPILTGRENIYVNASVLGLSKRETDAKLDEIIDFAEIGEFIDTPVQNYSSGMAVRLGFAVAAKVSPDILLLDEVLAVGDMAFQAKCYNALSEFRRRGVAFILVSHNMHVITRYCEKVLYMRRGEIVHHGEAAAGVALFESDMQAHGGTRAKSEPEAFGSGRVRIASHEFRDDQGRRINQAHASRPFSLAVEYECFSPGLEDVVLDVVVRSGSEILYQGRSDGYGQVFRLGTKKGVLKARFESLPVRDPSVVLSFCIMDRKTAEIYDWRRNLDLPMEWDGECTGRLAPRMAWTCEEIRDPADERAGA